MFSKAHTTRRPAVAFTIIEMLVVITVIGIIAAMVLPSIVRIFTAGADAQCRNILAGQLASARSLAIQHRTYAGVHIQPADTNGAHSKEYGGAWFSVVISKSPDPNDPNHYVVADGAAPRQLPGTMAVGHASGVFVNGSQYDPNDIVTDNPQAFCSVTILFGPSGQLEQWRDVQFYDGDPNDRDPIFRDPNDRAYLWDVHVADDPNCSRAVDRAVMFDRDKFDTEQTPEDKIKYLRDYGTILAVAPITGAVLSR